jgi:hypothetical protein
VSDPCTVTVSTLDHGDVTVPEPFWCTGVHPAGGYRADIAHDGEEVALVVDTACHGEVRVLSAALYQGPFSEHETTDIVVAVEFGDPDPSQAHSFDSSELAAVADSLVAWSVGPLHDLITRLQLLEGDDS